MALHTTNTPHLISPKCLIDSNSFMFTSSSLRDKLDNSKIEVDVIHSLALGLRCVSFCHRQDRRQIERRTVLDGNLWGLCDSLHVFKGPSNGALGGVSLHGGVYLNVIAH
jgi:hypothetical protein